MPSKASKSQRSQKANSVYSVREKPVAPIPSEFFIAINSCTYCGVHLLTAVEFLVTD